MIVVNKSVLVVINSVPRELAGIAVQVPGEVVREDEVEVVNDIENAFSSYAELFPDPVGLQGPDIPGMLVELRVVIFCPTKYLEDLQPLPRKIVGMI